MVDSVVNLDNAANPEGDAARAAHDAKMAEVGAGVTIKATNSQTGANYEQTAAPVEPTVDTPAPDVEPEVDTGRPEWLPEKFKTVEDMAKAYGELEAKLGKPAEPAPEASSDAAGEENADEAPQGTAVERARAEFAEKGALDDATYKALEAEGLDRATVDSYIAGQQAGAESLRTAAFEQTGGEEGFNKMAAWAQENLTSGEVKALDALLTSTDAEVVAAGASQLAARFKAEADVEPAALVHGQATPAGSHFKSSHDMTTAMADPRYARDESYRRSVAAKVAASMKAGVNLFT